MRSCRLRKRSIFAPVLAAVLLAGALPPGGEAWGAAYPAGPGNRVLSATDAVLLEEANRAADRDDWTTARRLAGQSSDPVAARIIEWRHVLDEGSRASFADITAFLNRYPDWPSRARILARAEQDMPPELGPSEVVAWFGDRSPETPDGAVRLGSSLIAIGRQDEGTEIVRSAWIENSFAVTEEREILSAFGSVIRPADQQARLERLLAGNNVDDARRQLERVDAQPRRVAEARITLKTTPGSASNILASLDPQLHTDAWLAYDRARALRRNGDDEAAWAAMRSVEGPLPDPDSWWLERHIMARDALKIGEYDISYELTSENDMQSGGGFADAEFLAGWIALRHQNRPDVALNHFQTLAGGVSFPISRARAHYWSGRALEAMGRMEEARTSYERASGDPTTYYGQLALTRLSPEPVLSLPIAMPDPDRRLDNDERIHAMNALVDLGRTALLRVFALHMANEDRSPGRMRYITDFMSAAGDRVLTLRIAKLASYSDVMLLPYLVPVIEIPQAAVRDRVEPALVLGITRQETEFDEAAVRVRVRGVSCS